MTEQRLHRPQIPAAVIRLGPESVAQRVKRPSIRQHPASQLGGPIRRQVITKSVGKQPPRRRRTSHDTERNCWQLGDETLLRGRKRPTVLASPMVMPDAM
jgi:hypothetical protein